ncbi:hypothetical protein BGZ72_000228 [Mortierella alpina]|nr:hypothetical protein BGZ72_000228 [Mortierella alpina]
MATPMKLFCLVDGESTFNAFPVEIGPDQTIGDLKNLIKTKRTPRFDDVAADELTLWRVSISFPDDNDDEAHILLDSLDEKKKLGPATRLSKVFPEDFSEETIHILVQRTPPAPAEDITAATVFTVTVKGRTPATLQWIADTTTATLDELRADIYKNHPTLNNGLKTIVVDESDTESVLYLESDKDLRTHLRVMLHNNVHHIPVRLEGRPRPFTEFTGTDTDMIYGSNSPLRADVESAAITTPEYTQALDDLFVTLKAAIKAMPPQDTAGYSLYVSAFLLHAVSLFPDLRLTLDKEVSGRRGYGSLLYAVESKADPSHVLPVTIPAFGRGLSMSGGSAQNMVQLDTISSGRKRKFEDMDDATPVTTFGIVTNAMRWSFQQCTVDTLQKSGFNDPTFYFADAPTIVDYIHVTDKWEADVGKIFGHVVWQLQRMVDETSHKTKRSKK